MFVRNETNTCINMLILIFVFQVNCLSFNPYSEFILATGSADKVKSFILVQIRSVLITLFL